MERQQEGGLPLMAGPYTVTIDQRIYRVVPVSKNLVEADGIRHDVDLVSLDQRSFSLILDKKTYLVEMVSTKSTSLDFPNGDAELGRTRAFTVNGSRFNVRIDDDRSLLVRSLNRKAQSSGGIQIIRAPMPGLISRIEVRIEEEVTEGKGLLILEAMKMENEIRALGHGRVQSIHVQRGKTVEKGEPLVTIKGL
jgi:biotin carboxyl carrier protein